MQHRAKEIGRRRCVPTLHRHDIERKPVLLCTESEVAYLEALDLVEAYPAHLDVILQAIEEGITPAQRAQQP